MMPDSLDIFGKCYVIEPKEAEPSGTDYGECDADQCRIQIAEFQCEQQKRDTLLHEAMHAIDHELHCNMSEAQVRRMATGVLAVLRQNPALAAFLLA